MVVGSNPSTVYWMDIFSRIFVVKICKVCLKRPKINEKEAENGPFFNNALSLCYDYSDTTVLAAYELNCKCPTRSTFVG